MDETMNLNGMGIGSPNPPVEINIKPEETGTIENAASESSIVSSTQSNVVETTEQTTVDAENQIDFQNLDMIKELRAEEAEQRKKESIFSSMDFGPLKKYLEDDDVTDISYSNGGQLWLKTLSKGVYRVDEQDINDALIEKIAFQCSNVMGKTFNMAHPFLDSESAELRMNFIHDSIARNGIAVVFRKTPAKIRLEKDRLMKENYVSLSIHDFLIKAVQGHCNIIMCGETGSGKTEFLKYLASHTFENEKIVTVEDTLELHLDRIFPQRDIVAMKTNNVASYSDVLVTCMRQNPIWILLSEVRSAEAVTAVRNSISSGHFILSTIHADKAANIPYRLYSLLESNIDVEQFLNTIYRYVQIGVYLRGRFDTKQGRFVREIGEVTEFYVNDKNECVSNTIYLKNVKGDVTYKPISDHLLEYLEGQGIDMSAIREANGDLEKAQSYKDELNEDDSSDSESSAETTSQTEVKPEVKQEPVVVAPPVEVKPVAPVEKPEQPAVVQQPEIKIPTEVKPEVKQEPVVIASPVEVKPVAPVEKPEQPAIVQQPEIKIPTEVKPEETPIEIVIVPHSQPVIETPIEINKEPVKVEEPKVVPITQDIKPVNAVPTIQSALTPSTSELKQITPQPIINPENTTQQPVKPLVETNSDDSEQGANFSVPNITNIQ